MAGSSEGATFKVGGAREDKSAVENWQRFIRDKFRSWRIYYPIKIDGFYGQATRAATATLLRAWGAESAAHLMRNGVTPWLRTKVRKDRRSIKEKALFLSPNRVAYRRALRKKHNGGGVAMPVAHVIADSWGYHPPIHDGLDLICREDATIYAMCDAEVVRADASGWWGKGAQPSPGHPISHGDGVIILRVAKTVGPFKKGMNLVYGHAEHAKVKVGQKVKAGQPIGRAGYANAPHIHLCVNQRGDTKGVGTQDPRPLYNYARKNS